MGEVRPHRPALSDRAHAILSAIVQEYVETAEPVSSRSALARAGLSVSPATVRSVMSMLEELGLLAQPHASAGRVPTDLAFRHYVDRLLREPRSGGPDVVGADHELVESAGSPEGVLRSAVEWLSRATGQVGFSVGLPMDRTVLAQLRFVRVSSERVMAVLVFRTGVVQNRVFEESDTDQRGLDRCSAWLSEWADGLTLIDLRRRLASEVAIDRERRDSRWKRALALARAGTEPRVDDLMVYVGQRAQLFSHPEFEDVSRLREVVEALDAKERLLSLLDRTLASRVLRVTIGEELDDPDIRFCAVVAAPLGEGATPGGIGVIGPVRMRYDQVIPAVRTLSRRVAGYLG